MPPGMLPALARLPPYVCLPCSFGPIQPVGGVLVGIGVARGFRLALRLALDPVRLENHVFGTVAIGVVASRVRDPIFDHPEVLRPRPWEGTA